MRVRLTDQAAVAVTLARAAAAGADATVAHLLVGLTTEPEGRAGRRLRERGTAAARLVDRAAGTTAAPLEAALTRAAAAAGERAVGTVELLDAALAVAGEDLEALLVDVGYHRDLDGWLTADPALEWFEDAETFGYDPAPETQMDAAASRVVAQVAAVGGGAVEVLIAAAAAPDSALDMPDPRDLAATAARLGGHGERWDMGLDVVITAAQTLSAGQVVRVPDLVTAALVAGGDGPRLVSELATPDEHGRR